MDREFPFRCDWRPPTAQQYRQHRRTVGHVQPPLSQLRDEVVARGAVAAHPIFAARAHGSGVWDVKGREYLDFVAGFATTGAEAVENAVKIARAATGRSAIIAFHGGFHGRTLRLGGILAAGLAGLVARHECVGDVRGIGTMQAIRPAAATARYR